MPELQLPENWNELYIVHSGDNTFSNYAFTFSINRVSLETLKKFTFYELWGGDATDWGNIIYDSNKKSIKLQNQNASDNQILVSIR